MRRQDWAVLAFKMIGGVIAAHGLIALGSLPSFFAPRADGADLPAAAALLGLLPAWMAIGVGAAFWFAAPAFASHVFPDAPPPDFAEPLDVNGTLQLGLALFGVYLVIVGLPSLLAGVSYLVMETRATPLSLAGGDGDRADDMSEGIRAGLVEAGTKLALGFALILNRARLAAHLKPTRVVNPFAEDEPPEPQQS
jgi:hypothetical protein